MIERVKIWYVVRSPREQRLVLIMAITFALVFIWLGIARPLNDALVEARARHTEAVIERAEARAQAEALGSLRSAGGARPLTEPVETLIGRAAGQAGFQLSRLQADPGGAVSIGIEAARPQALFAWVSSLERQGVVVASLTASANADRTVAVQASFRGRSGG
jgi:general secretion pathway protein M